MRTRRKQALGEIRQTDAWTELNAFKQTQIHFRVDIQIPQLNKINVIRVHKPDKSFHFLFAVRHSGKKSKFKETKSPCSFAVCMDSRTSPKE